MKIHEYNQMMNYLTRPEAPSLPPVSNPAASIEQREAFAEGDIVKASDLSKLLKEYDVEISPKNIGRFSKNYEIKKDPNRPSASGFYVEPSEKQLKKIASQYEKNILKAPGSTEAGKEAFKKREARARELLTQGYNQTEADNILKKEFNMSMKSTLTNIANDLREEGVKIISGRESEIKTPASKFAKERRRLQDVVSDASKERLMAKLKREAGYGDVDLSHRLSMKQNEILGTKLISSNLGLDPKKVNREIVKPIENKLNKIFNDQMKVVGKIKKEGTSLQLRKELEELNKKVTDIVEATDRRLQGNLIDEITLKPKQYGVNYATSFGAGVIPDKPISQLTKQEIELAIKQIPGQLKAIKKEPSLATRMSNQLASGPSGIVETGEAVIEDVKGLYGKYAPKIAKGALTALQVAGTPLASSLFYGTDVGMELKQAAEEGNLTAKKALDAFLGQGEKGLYFLLPELAKDVVTSPIANKILQLGKIGRFATPVGLGLSAVGVGKDFYDQYKEFQALSPEEKERRIKESTYTPTEQDFQQMQELESRASAAKGGRIGFAEGTPTAGAVYVGSWEGPWTGPEFLGGPRKGQYYNSSKNSLTAITGPDGAIPRPGMPITTIQSPQKSETISTSEIPLTTQERYNKYLSESGSKSNTSDLENRYRELIRSTPATGLPVSIPTPVNEGTTLIKGGLSFISPEGEKITFGSLTGFRKPNGESYTGPIPENIRNATRFLAANGGRIGFADGSDEIQIPTLTKKPKSSIYGKYASQIANGKVIERGPKQKGKLGPEDPLSKYKSYSEEELAGNIEAKKPNFDTLEDYILQTMPVFEPKDVAPPKSYSPMQVLPGLNAPGFAPPVDLKDGGPSDPSKRKFIKGAGIVGAVGLASKFIPDLFQAAKKGTKVVPKKAPFVNIVRPLGATETKFPEWFPSLVSRLRKEGNTKPIYATEEIPLTKEQYLKLKEKGTDRIYDRYTGFTENYVNELKQKGVPQHYQIKDTDDIIGYEYIDKNIPDVKAVEYNGEEMNVYFKNNYGQQVEVQYVAPGKKTKEGQFAVADARPEPGSYYDSAPDFEQVYVTDIDEVLGGSGKVEQYATKAKTPRYTKGAAEVDEAEGRALSEIDRLKDEGLIDE